MAVKSNSSHSGNQFSTWITVSHKGQIAIPISVRKKLNINVGDRLLVMIRKDQDGINLLKSEVVNEVFEKFLQ